MSNVSKNIVKNLIKKEYGKKYSEDHKQSFVIKRLSSSIFCLREMRFQEELMKESGLKKSFLELSWFHHLTSNHFWTIKK